MKRVLHTIAVLGVGFVLLGGIAACEQKAGTKKVETTTTPGGTTTTTTEQKTETSGENPPATPNP